MVDLPMPVNCISSAMSEPSSGAAHSAARRTRRTGQCRRRIRRPLASFRRERLCHLSFVCERRKIGPHSLGTGLTDVELSGIAPHRGDSVRSKILRRSGSRNAHGCRPTRRRKPPPTPASSFPRSSPSPTCCPEGGTRSPQALVTDCFRSLEFVPYSRDIDSFISRVP
jgi:hypothetical protein